MSENLGLLESLFIALALGIFIGAERGIATVRKEVDEKKTFAGIRTFALISLLGALSIHFSNQFGKIFFVFSFLGFVFLVIVAYSRTSKQSEDVGTTTEVTALLTFLYGALCMTEYRLAAVVLTVFTTLLLYTKKYSHAFIRGVTEEEFYATLKFAIIAFVILPFLPRVDYLGFLNLYELWIIVVIISAIELASYISIKLLPPRKGFAVIGLLGGIVSSTALVLNSSRQSKKESALTNSLAFSSALASSTVFLKLMAEVYIFNKSLIRDAFLPLAVLFSLGIVGALLLRRKEMREGGTESVDLKSPFTLTPALKFAAIFGAVIFLTSYASKTFGEGGIYFSSALGGIVNLDAPTVSLANLAYKGITAKVAVLGIVIAACINTIVKVGIAFFYGSREFARLVAVSFAFPIVGGIAYIILLVVGLI